MASVGWYEAIDIVRNKKERIEEWNAEMEHARIRKDNFDKEFSLDLDKRRMALDQELLSIQKRNQDAKALAEFDHATHVQALYEKRNDLRKAVTDEEKSLAVAQAKREGVTEQISSLKEQLDAMKSFYDKAAELKDAACEAVVEATKNGQKPLADALSAIIDKLPKVNLEGMNVEVSTICSGKKSKKDEE